MVIGVSQNVFATLVSVEMSTAFVFLVFIVIMVLRPSGLFGQAARVA